MISSSATIAALGPPMPVAWTVSGCAVDGDPAVPPEAAVVVEHLGHAGDQLLGEPERAAGVARGAERAPRRARAGGGGWSLATCGVVSN